MKYTTTTVRKKILEIIKCKGGKIIECSNYKLAGKTPYEWYQKQSVLIECAKKHRFTLKVRNLFAHSWCRECSFLKKIERNGQKIREIVVEKRGKCLFTEFEGTKFKYQFQCEKNHVFSLRGSYILSGKWCKFCSKLKRQQKGFERLQKICEQRGGILLSTNFTSVKMKYKYRCHLKHEFESLASNILTGQWCPDCNQSLVERMCRVVIENIFNNSFPSCFPAWLISANNTKLQLDGYCEELKVAFEYNGIQHYKQMHFDSKEKFEKRKNRDKHKIEVCKERGVKLIIIPSFRLAYKNIQTHVEKACQKAGFGIDINYKIDLSPAYATWDLERIIRVKQKLIDLGGELISYQGARCEVICNKCKNQWVPAYSTLMRGAWCYPCSLENKRKGSLALLHSLAEKNGGTCLAAEFISLNTKVLWKCSIAKHTSWPATTRSIKKGSWCPECKKEKQKKKKVNKKEGTTVESY